MIVLSAVVLVGGVVLGLLPVHTTLTQVAPELRLLTVSCGDGYLGGSPTARPGDLVELPVDGGVLLPRSAYTAHCDEAVGGWRRPLAWALTAVGALGLAAGVVNGRTFGSGMPRASRRDRRTV